MSIIQRIMDAVARFFGNLAYDTEDLKGHPKHLHVERRERKTPY